MSSKTGSLNVTAPNNLNRRPTIVPITDLLCNNDHIHQVVKR